MGDHRGQHLCTCGHFRSDHKPVCECRCPVYERGEYLRACGHVPDDDPCADTPSIRRAFKAQCTPEVMARAGGPAELLRRLRRERQYQRHRLPYRKVWDRDGWQCVRCGSHKDLTVDHIIPVSKGGADDLSNLQTLCKSCNSSKGARVLCPGSL